VYPIEAAHDVAYTTHALSPAALLQTYAAVVGGPAPAAFVIAIRGEQFELGEAMSADAELRLAAALDDLVGLLRRRADRAPAPT